MSTTVYSLNPVLEVIANKYIDWVHDESTRARRIQILPATKYNLLVKSFNASTLLLTTALVISIFSLHVGIVFGAYALFVRFTVEKEMANLIHLSEPQIGEQEEGANQDASRIWRLVQDAFRAIRGDYGNGGEILHQLGSQDRNWNADQLVFCGYPLLKYPAPLPSSNSVLNQGAGNLLNPFALN